MEEVGVYKVYIWLGGDDIFIRTILFLSVFWLTYVSIAILGSWGEKLVNVDGRSECRREKSRWVVFLEVLVVYMEITILFQKVQKITKSINGNDF